MIFRRIETAWGFPAFPGEAAAPAPFLFAAQFSTSCVFAPRAGSAPRRLPGVRRPPTNELPTALRVNRPSDALSPRDCAGEWIERFAALIAATARRHCPRGPGIDPEDLAQEMRVRLWRALLAETEIRNVPAFVRGVALHAAVDLLRRQKGPRAFSFSDLSSGEEGEEAPVAGGADPAEEAVAEEDFSAAIAGVMESRRRVVTMHLAGFDRESIARTLGFSADKVRNLLYRGLEDLRRGIAERRAS